MKNFKFSHGLFIGLILGLVSSLFINTNAQTPMGLFIERGSNKMIYTMQFETIEFRHHGESIDVDVHKLISFLRTLN